MVNSQLATQFETFLGRRDGLRKMPEVMTKLR